ncbi:hypothetical protein GQ607_006454 [Colletotrichum asianum]|uniref:Uncharacterized protein n=1 Tax=Colletotrichum asianum TaxID=702518 RepID=A0A8H3WCC2_9PEZI|nr:hypothetical protein GQ607_006454 [Colletotrichum asianum]
MLQPQRLQKSGGGHNRPAFVDLDRRSPGRRFVWLNQSSTSRRSNDNKRLVFGGGGLADAKVFIDPGTPGR